MSNLSFFLQKARDAMSNGSDGEDEPDIDVLDNSDVGAPSRRKRPRGGDDKQPKKRTRKNVVSSITYASLSKHEDDIDYYSSCDEEESLSKKSKDKSLFSGEENSDSEESDEEEEEGLTNAEKYSPLRCFACMWGNPRQSAINRDNINTCIKIIEENYGKLDNLCVARMVHCYFKREIWEPNRKNGDIPLWRTIGILKHIEEHTLEPRIFIGEGIKRNMNIMKQLEKKFEKKVRTVEGNEIEILDDKAIRSYYSSWKLILDLYRMNPRSMNYYNEECGISMDSIGKLVNVNRNWKITPNKTK